MKLYQTGIPKIAQAHRGVQPEFKVIRQIPARASPPAAGKFPFLSVEIF